METKAIKAAITSIENQLEILKASCGLSSEVGEEHHEEDDDETDNSENKTQPEASRARRRGRHKLMAQFEKESD